MATIGQTKLKTIELMETAIHRCGKMPEILTAEHLATATLTTYTVIAHLANNGLQLWCIDKDTFPLTVGQGTYQDPLPGAEEIEEAVFRQPRVIDPLPATVVSTVTATATLVAAGPVAAVGYLPSASGVLTILIEGAEGAGYQPLYTTTVVAENGVMLWFVLDRQLTAATAIRLRETALPAIVAGMLVLAYAVVDTPMQPMSRDEYAWQPNKLQTGGVPCLYYLERKTTPVLNVYPPSSGVYDHLIVWWKRNIQDLTSLSAYIEVPTRWYHAMITSVAAALSLDLPDVDSARVEILQRSATAAVALAAGVETDKGPARIMPRITGYTR